MCAIAINYWEPWTLEHRQSAIWELEAPFICLFLLLQTLSCFGFPYINSVLRQDEVELTTTTVWNHISPCDRGKTVRAEALKALGEYFPLMAFEELKRWNEEEREAEINTVEWRGGSLCRDAPLISQRLRSAPLFPSIISRLSSFLNPSSLLSPVTPSLTSLSPVLTLTKLKLHQSGSIQSMCVSAHIAQDKTCYWSFFTQLCFH